MKRLALCQPFFCCRRTVAGALFPAHLKGIVLKLTCEVYVCWVNPELVTVDSLLHCLSICSGLNDSVCAYQLPVLQDTVCCISIV